MQSDTICAIFLELFVVYAGFVDVYYGHVKKKYHLKIST